MIIILSKDFEFESAQSLPQFPEGHKCRKVHGHSFKVTISVRGPVDEASGIFYDHADVSGLPGRGADYSRALHGMPWAWAHRKRKDD